MMPSDSGSWLFVVFRSGNNKDYLNLNSSVRSASLERVSSRIGAYIPAEFSGYRSTSYASPTNKR